MKRNDDHLVRFNNGFVAGLASAVAIGTIYMVVNAGIKGEYRAGNAAILGLSITVAVAATWHGRRE